MYDDYVSIWEIYGLKTDPFTPNPILVKGGLIDPKSFVGRIDELKRIEKLFRTAGGSRSMIYGTQGVGKTSLVNVARIKALDKGFFTPFQEIRMDADWNADDFVYNTISAIYSTLIKFQNPNQKIKDLIEDLKPVCDAYETVDGTYGISTPLGGGSIGKNRTINKPEINTVFLMSLFEKIVTSLKDAGFREVILHYNNLDNYDEEEVKLKKLFNKIRDFIQTPYVHFVFIGSPTTLSMINSLPRVSSIVTDTPIQVTSLSLEEVKRIITTRIELSAIEGMNFFKPVTEDSIELLYELHNGNIRAILNSLSTAVREVTEEKPVLVSKDVLRRILYKLAQKRLTDKAKDATKDVLMEILKRGECTNKTIANNLDKKPQNISKYINDLKDLGCIYLSRTEGQKKYYRVDEWVRWVLLDPSKQMRISQF